MTHSPDPSAPYTDHSFKKQVATKGKIVNEGLDYFIQLVQKDRSALQPPADHVDAAVDSYLEVLGRGGKHMRGMLVVTGYGLYGGTDMKMIARAAGAVEALHSYLLVLDDVADNSTVRRGGPTAHIIMGEYFMKESTGPSHTDARDRGVGESAKLGVDMAQLAAIYAQNKALSVFSQLDVSDRQSRLVGRVLNDMLAQTGIGQMLDLAPSDSEAGTIEHALRVATYKTAFYSFLMPLKVGAILAGADVDSLGYLEEYSLHAGMAFQLQDDVLGIAGDQQLTGKSRTSDIQEGKMTVPIITALQRASELDQKILRSALDNVHLRPASFNRCLEIIRATGALEKTNELIVQHTKAAQRALDTAASASVTPLDLVGDLAARDVQFLRDITQYNMERQT